jgi:glutaredoxin-like protein
MFLQKRDQKQLREYFASRLQQPVQLLVFGQTCCLPEDPHPFQQDLCQDAYKLLQEVAAASPLISIQWYDAIQNKPASVRYKVDKQPAIVVLGNGIDYGIRFYGVPSHFEFVTFLETLATVSSLQFELCASTLQALAQLTQPVHIQVFHTPNCAFCPLMTHLALMFAIASPMVRCDSIDAAQFAQLAQHYGVKGVPHVVINENTRVIGMRREEEFLQALLEVAQNPCPVKVAV